MSENVQNVKRELEAIFNAPARIANGAIKVNVKEVTPSHFKSLEMFDGTEISIKRSGAGVAVIAKPI